MGGGAGSDGSVKVNVTVKAEWQEQEGVRVEIGASDHGRRVHVGGRACQQRGECGAWNSETKVSACLQGR